MIVAPLGSGSAGNCYFFESDGTSLLIDAGFSMRETEKRLRLVERDLGSISAILITHEHGDHIRGAETIARHHGIPIYLTRGTLEASRISRIETPTVVFENNTTFRIRDLQVSARRTMHDAADPSCFVVEGGDGTRVGLASDLGHVDAGVLEHLSNCDGLLFEANHDLDMLREGSYPWSLKRRIMSRVGHLSNDDSMRALQRMMGPDLKNICLIHLSAHNNHESIVRDLARRVISGTGAQIELAIAPQHSPLGTISIRRSAPRRTPAPAAARLSAASMQMRLF